MQRREARIKAIRERTLSCAIKLKDSNEDKSHQVKKYLSDFPKETEDFEDSEPPSKKRAMGSTSSVTGKKFQWLMKPPQPKFTSLSSVPNFSGKGKGAAETISSPIEAWSLLYSDDILNIILKYTNQEIEQYRSIVKNPPSHCNMLDILELKTFLGLLYYAGWSKKNNGFIGQCFSVHNLPLFRAITSIQRIEFLFHKLLFDDKTTRDKRIKSDCFAHIREIWDLFITNCIQYYEPGYNVTIDKQILSFRGECPTDMSLSYKRDKLGLKFVTMNDSETFYMINAIPYMNNVKTEPLGKFFSHVIKTSEPIHNTGRNVTCGSWCTSIPLVDTMREKFSLTMIGSLQQNNPDVPPWIKNALAKEPYQFAYDINKTLVSYKPENDKMILLLSSLHSDEINKVDNKPEIVLHYNKIMGASDTFDQLCHQYTVTRGTGSWPLRIFYGMLDQAAVNSYVLYTLNANNRLITRDNFLLALSMTLIKPYLKKLLSCSNSHILVQYRLKSFLDEYDFSENDPRNLQLDISNKLSKKAKCYLCPTFQRRCTRNKCLKCNNSICMMHKASICQSCAENQFL